MTRPENSIAARLIDAREAAGLTIEEAARRAAVSVRTLKAWESGKTTPRPNKLQMLAGVLNVSIVWLLTGQGEGVSAPAEANGEEELSMLAELRDIRLSQTRLIERLARIEKRLRAAAHQRGRPQEGHPARTG